MKKLDRLDWTEGLSLSAFGVRTGVRVNVPGVLPRVLPLLPPGWKKNRTVIVERLYSLVVAQDGERPGIRRLHVLYADSTPIARGAALDQVLAALETNLHRYIAEAARDMTFLHAGVVGWQGQAILFPGRSLSGKTTLVREMLRLGASYYSDEFAVVDNSGSVHPFPRPLGIREGHSYAQTKYTAERLGAACGVRPLPMGMAVICKYEPGARWQPVPLSQGQGALELLANSVAIRSQPHQTISRLHHLAQHAVFIKGTRGEAHKAAAYILNESSARVRREIA
jgi:hypothetical protein